MTSSDLQTVAAFEAFGASVRILASHDIAPALAPTLPPGAVPTSDRSFDESYAVTAIAPSAGFEDGGYELSRNGTFIGRSRSLEKIRREIDSDVHFRIACSAKGFLFVHAGVVEWRDRVIVLPGRSMTGKSSLVLALVRAGARYFSDEYAVVDPDGLVWPYPKPLSQRLDGSTPRLHSAEDLGALVGAARKPIGLIALLRFREDARWNPQRLSRAEAVLGLLDNTVVAQTNPEFALDLLARAVRDAEALQGDRGDAAETARVLLNA